MSLSLEGAGAILLPPEPGLRFLRHDRASALRLEPGSVSIDDGRIEAIEPDASAGVRFDASGCTVVPGLVDCHTHLPFVGWRAVEYAAKVSGASYEELARSGSGIAASARALREATDEEVLTQARGLADEMLRHGTTTFECKSGYGLTREAEIRLLNLAMELGELIPQSITSTALLAHAVPAGLTAGEWMETVGEMVPELAAETDVSALDIYVESIAFDNDALLRMGELAEENGLALRAHVEQFACHRSIRPALEANARSVDHLACIHPDDLAPLAESECAAVFLPGAEFLGAEEKAPARELADAGAICVLATDANPGTSPVVSLPLIAGLAVRMYGWTPLEALLALTLNAAYTLDLSDEIGTIEPGKRADLVVLDGPVEHMPYRFGHNPVVAVIVDGHLAWVRDDAAERMIR